MDTLSILLKSDLDKFKKPAEEVEMERLTEELGEKVMFKLQAIDSKTFGDIQKMATNIGETVDIDVSKLQHMMIANGVVEPDLKSKELMDHFKVYTPTDLIDTFLLPGEITMLSDRLNKLSGFSDEKKKVETVKN